MKRSRLLVILLLALVATGCTHALEITNLDEYYAPPPAPFKQQMTVGVTSPNTGDAQNGRYVGAVVDALQRSGSFDRVIYPFSQAEHGSIAQVVLDIGVSPKYDGSGSNFFVNFPGFLIFAPAIWGYEYQANITTSVKVTDQKSGRSRDAVVPTNYIFRQAEIDRTWTEVGWFSYLFPIPLVGGFFFMEYDPDVTREFITTVAPSYGPYVAGKVLPVISEFREQAPPSPVPEQLQAPPSVPAEQQTAPPDPAAPQQPPVGEEKKAM